MLKIELIQVAKNLTYEEYPIRIVDSMEKVLRRAIVKLVKVQWNNHEEWEATWELEEREIKEKY